MNAKMFKLTGIRNWLVIRGIMPAILALLALAVLFVPVLALTLVSETTWGGADSDVTRGAAVAADGSTSIAGITRNFGGSSSRLIIFVVKFAADESLAWQRTWTGPQTFGSDEARDVAVAPDGSTYVTGSTLGTAGDVLLLKFDANGSLVWQRRWGGSGTESGEGVAVVPDGSGIYVTGGTSSFGSSGFVVKFADDGTLVWQKTWTGSVGEGVAVAQDGNLYVAGVGPRPDTTVGADVVLLKIDPAGNLIWQRSYSAGEIVDARGGLTVAVDDSIYVAGALQEVTNSAVIFDAVLLKFTPDGNLVWDRGWGGRDGDDAGGVSVAADGTIFLTGTTASFGAGGGGDAFLVQLLPTGRAMDAMAWGGAGLDRGEAVGIRPDGSISLAGTTEGPPFSFLRAGTRTSRLRGSVGVPAVVLVDASGTVSDPAGTVRTPNGSLTFAGGFDAALVKIMP